MYVRAERASKYRMHCLVICAREARPSLSTETKLYRHCSFLTTLGYADLKTHQILNIWVWVTREVDKSNGNIIHG